MPTIFALGASPNVIEKHYRREAAYQRPLLPLDERVLEDLHDPSKFFEYLADEKYYRDYLVYFQEEIGNKGYQDVVNEYLFKGDKRADYVLGVLLAGYVHSRPSTPGRDSALTTVQLSPPYLTSGIRNRVQSTRSCR